MRLNFRCRVLVANKTFPPAGCCLTPLRPSCKNTTRQNYQTGEKELTRPHGTTQARTRLPEQQRAERRGAPAQETDDLFKAGVLDSFALVDFLAVLEEHAGIKVPDSDVNPSNFQTIQAIERYAEGRKGQGA
jgi:acyl carrier protein